MDLVDGLKRILSHPGLEHATVQVERIAARPGAYGQLSEPLPAPLQSALQRAGIGQLYSHQVEAIELARAGRDLVVVTGTASGKTLCYNLPVLEACLRERTSAALYLFPTKALCQDQLGTLEQLPFAEPELARSARPAVYDGDTPQSQRRCIRAEANLVLTNPDMLHVGILPYHAKWARLLARLRFVVLDEVHTYRGIFGANVACLLRRLQRLCEHYGSRPQFLAASATIANPAELVERLVGRPVELIERDGSPSGPKYFLLINPPPVRPDATLRRSASELAAWLMAELIRLGAQVIAFTRTRQGAELVYRSVRDRLGPGLGERVRAYRGGYLPQQRRAIESALFRGELKGVVSTNALELGIDVGSLDAAILIGYPGTIASAWQQAGRAGRRNLPSLAVLIAQNDPIDQYLVRHPEYLIEGSPEHAVVDPENQYVLANHMLAAAFELPLDEPDAERFGPAAAPIASRLEQAGHVNRVGTRFFPTAPLSPAAEFSIRHMSNNVVAIVERTDDSAAFGKLAVLNGFQLPGLDPFGSADTQALGPKTPYAIDRCESSSGQSGPRRGRCGVKPPEPPHGFRVIANVDAISAPELVYPQAIYLHDGDTYFVRKLDLPARLAYVERVETDYYTQAILESQVRVAECRASRVLRQPAAGPWQAQRPWLETDSPDSPDKPEKFRRSGLLDSSPAASSPPGVSVACFGHLEVTWRTVAFKKIKFETRENVGFGSVDLPAQELPTTGLWIVPAQCALAQLRDQGLEPYEGLVGLRNLFVQAMPLLAMCDPRDISGVVNASNLGVPAVFIYDRYPGGLGYCEKGYQLVDRLLQTCWQMVEECPCESGCPSCVGLPNFRPAQHSDPDLVRGWPIPSKEAARLLSRSLAAECEAGKPQKSAAG